MKSSSWAARLTVAIAGLYFVTPLVATLEFSLRMRRGEYSLDAYRAVLSDTLFQASFGYSIFVALLTIVLGTLLIVPTAFWVHWKLPRWRPVIEFITLLPLVIPAIVLVFGYLRLFNSSAWLSLTDTNGGTNALLVVAYVTLTMPYLYRSVDVGLQAMDVKTLTEAAQVLGAGRLTILLRVILPNLRSAILSGAFLTFAIVMGEFTIASLLNRPAFGPYMQMVGANSAYEPAALAILAFALTWGCMGLINLLGRHGAASTSPL